jgi:hypothetical protein
VALTKYAKIGGHTEIHFAITGRRELLVWKKKRITDSVISFAGTPIPDRNCR